MTPQLPKKSARAKNASRLLQLSNPSRAFVPITSRYSTPVGELLDVLNAAGLPTGEAKARALVHRDGDLHRTLHVWIVKDDRNVLLQRRAATKDPWRLQFPNTPRRGRPTGEYLAGRLNTPSETPTLD